MKSRDSEAMRRYAAQRDAMQDAAAPDSDGARKRAGRRRWWRLLRRS